MGPNPGLGFDSGLHEMLDPSKPFAAFALVSSELPSAQLPGTQLPETREKGKAPPPGLDVVDVALCSLACISLTVSGRLCLLALACTTAPSPTLPWRTKPGMAKAGAACWPALTSASP